VALLTFNNPPVSNAKKNKIIVLLEEFTNLGVYCDDTEHSKEKKN
jgi:hypothetical protein